MAGTKGNEWWLILLLLVVATAALAVVVMSSGRKAVAPAVSQDILADKPQPAMNVVEPMALKSAHSQSDQAAAALVKPQSAVVLAPQTLPSKESFAVQVYSFKDKARADAALAKIKAKGFKAYILVSDLGERGVWYRVRVGSFATDDEARAVLDEVTTNFKSGIIVTE